ncbi:MAG: intradiol ring-cleavage dioxygenase [Pseudonocardia sp.]|nr:intradiol ring-cleavage dioxygenase [Pseudonocardia sp.]
MSAHDHHDDSPHEHDLGLAHDLPRLMGTPVAVADRVVGRRRLLGILVGAGALTLAGCAAAATGSSSAGTAAGAIPEETSGPFPGDGTNGPNVLTESGVVRSDIRSSFGSLTGTADGVPLTLTLTVVDASTGAPRPGAAVYLWHCDRAGAYSLYDVDDQNYLRGVQVADASGVVSFTSVFPAAYSGRWPHAHFEVYADLAAATNGDNATVTSQLALPEDACTAVYATDGYDSSVRNLAQTSLDSDMVFRDGYAAQLATVTGDVSGMAATLTVGV